MPDENVERQGLGRRKDDSECKLHEERLDTMDGNINKQSGWLKASGGFFGIVLIICVPFLSWIGSSILSKLNNIETLLSDNKVVIMKHTMQIEGLQGDVRDMKERHKFEDEKGVRK